MEFQQIFFQIANSFIFLMNYIFLLCLNFFMELSTENRDLIMEIEFSYSDNFSV